MRFRPLRFSLISALAAAFVMLGLFAYCSSKPEGEITIDEAAREIRFPARTQISAFSRSLFQPGHHFIVSAEGVSRFGALFNALVSDLDLRYALERLGAVPGENLRLETWNERDNPDSSAPDLRVEGTSIRVSIEYESTEYSFEDLVLSVKQTDDLAEEPDFRYGGNEAYRAEFHSGCIVCNYSCPGGAIGNHNATIRDETRERIVFSVVDPFPIPDGALVTVILRVAD